MTVTYGFYNSVGGDRTYDAVQMGQMFDGLFSYGVFSSVGGALIVTASSGMSVKVAAGRAWLLKSWLYNDADLVITLDAAHATLHRIDAIIVEANSDIGVRANAIKVLKGTPASSPQQPVMTNTETLRQIPLAYVLVTAGDSTISSGDITNAVGTSECPFVIGLDALNASPGIAGGRLTLTSGTPVTINDVTAATTVYYTPYLGNKIALYNGVSWSLVQFSNTGISLSGKAANTNYDVFVSGEAYSDTITLTLTAWTNDTTRAVDLVMIDGVYVNTTYHDLRYVGTIRTTGTTGQCEDSARKRFVWNYNNPVGRGLAVTNSTQHSYTTGTWRAWNNDAPNNKLEWVVGMQASAGRLRLMLSVEGTAMSVGAGTDTAGASAVDYVYNASTSVMLRFGQANTLMPLLGYHSTIVSEYGYASASFIYYQLRGEING